MVLGGAGHAPSIPRPRFTARLAYAARRLFRTFISNPTPTTMANSPMVPGSGIPSEPEDPSNWNIIPGVGGCQS